MIVGLERAFQSGILLVRLRLLSVLTVSEKLEMLQNDLLSEVENIYIQT